MFVGSKDDEKEGSFVVLRYRPERSILTCVGFQEDDRKLLGCTKVRSWKSQVWMMETGVLSVCFWSSTGLGTEVSVLGEMEQER